MTQKVCCFIGSSEAQHFAMIGVERVNDRIVRWASLGLALSIVSALLFHFGGRIWSDNSSLEAEAYNAAVDQFVPRLLDKQNHVANAYLFAPRKDCDIRHEAKYHAVLGTVTVRDFDGKDRTKGFTCLLSYDPVAKRWSDLGTRVLDQ